MRRIVVAALLALSLAASCAHGTQETGVRTETETRTQRLRIEPGPAAEIK